MKLTVSMTVLSNTVPLGSFEFDSEHNETIVVDLGEVPAYECSNCNPYVTDNITFSFNAIEVDDGFFSGGDDYVQTS